MRAGRCARARGAVAREARAVHHRGRQGEHALAAQSCASDALSCAKEVVKACVFAQHPPERAYLTLLNAAGERALDVARACESERCAEWLGRMTGGEARRGRRERARRRRRLDVKGG